jgi:hypothetical protein
MQLVCVGAHEMQILPDTPQYAVVIPRLQTPVGVQHPLQLMLLQIPPSTGPPSPLGVPNPSPPSPPDELPPDDDPPPGVGPLPPVVPTGGFGVDSDEHAPAIPAQISTAPVAKAATFMP